ncbi:MAG: putative metal-binding motif-containing protein, partial [Myxococcota bacterium]
LPACGGDWLVVDPNQPNQSWNDCDDTDATIHPEAEELCDAVDRNCDNDPIQGAVDGDPYYQDNDDDGYGGLLEALCDQTAPDGYVDIGGDCDDDSGATYPGAPDTCGDSVDQDCNGGDGNDSTILSWYPDVDHDGYGDETISPTLDCADLSASGDYTGPELALDCDDSTALVSPDGQEICNLVDDDCNGVFDDVGTGVVSWYEDTDQDGFGNVDFPIDDECSPGPDWITQGGDCDDGRLEIHPGADEICNEIDDDCDDKVDAADDDAIGVEFVWNDGDADGYGGCKNAACDPFPICPEDRTEFFADNADDCDDGNPARNPSRPEIAGNTMDEDCDGEKAEEPHAKVPEESGCNCDHSGATPFGGFALLLSTLVVGRRRRN